MNHFCWILLLVGGIIGCGRPNEAVKFPEPESGYPMTLTDSLGRSVTVARRPERIVSLSPAATETLFAIGAGPRVVAVTTVDNYPPEVKSLPQVGGFSPATVSVEAILSHRPDLVVVVSAGPSHQSLIESLDSLKLPVVALDASTLDQVFQAIRQVGRVVGESDRAVEVAESLHTRAEVIRRRTATIPAHQRPRVFFLISDEPLMTVGPDSFLGQIIQDAGGTNVFADTHQLFPMISDEEVIRRNPSLILAPDEPDPQELRKRVSARPGWHNIEAVKDGRFAFLNADRLSRPGPRLIEGMEEVAQALQPTH
jgi:iron complex transport system substrate-binding protein